MLTLEDSNHDDWFKVLVETGLGPPFVHKKLDAIFEDILQTDKKVVVCYSNIFLENYFVYIKVYVTFSICYFKYRSHVYVTTVHGLRYYSQ